MIAVSSMWHLVAQSDFFTKFIVFLLVFFSFLVVVYTVVATIVLKTKLKQLIFAKEYFLQREIFNEDEFVSQSPKSLAAYLVKSINKTTGTVDQLHEDFLFALAAEYFVRERKIIRFLGAAAAASPLVGLLGTVWGVIHAFLGMAQAQGADLMAVAPGIAEALITTLAGLFVAIPSLVAYHFLCELLLRCEDDVTILITRLILLKRS